MGRLLYYQDAKGAYQPLGDMNTAEFDKLRELDVFRVHYHNAEAEEYGLFIEQDAIDDAAKALIESDRFDGNLLLLLFRLATWPQQGAFLLW